MPDVAVSGSFDNIRSAQVRFLEEAARAGGGAGSLQVFLWSDEVAARLTGRLPHFSLAERLYILRSIRCCGAVHVAAALDSSDELPEIPGVRPEVWAVEPGAESPRKQDYCAAHGLRYHPLAQADLAGYPVFSPSESAQPGRKKVIVTGCYDWFHSGHIRFFEEASAYGDLYVAVGNDANVRQLKGAGHPLLGQDERRYMVQAVRFVTRALITSGMGWMDAAPDIEVLKPDIYLVNEDGDKPEKCSFCAEHGLEYVVLKRTPKEGLERRSSTDLRGF
jgi:cytidyltransferase-like protein